MTEKEYMDKLKEMILLYKQIKEMSIEINDAGFAAPIAMTVSPYSEEDKIHLHGNNLPDLDFECDADRAENWDFHSAKFAGVTLFYLTHKADINNEIGLTD
jgi:hypothetical protein